MMRAILRLAVVLFLLALTHGARADTAEIYARAVALVQQKKCDEALPLLRQAHDATQSPNARLLIARCLHEQGELVEAHEEMRLTVQEATTRARDDAKYAPTRDAAAAELAMLDAKVGKLIVAIADPPPDSSVLIGGVELPTDRLGKPNPVLPGTARIVAAAPGMQGVEREVEIAAGETRTLAIAFEPLSEDEPEDEPLVPADGEALGTIRIAGFVVAGLGLVGVGVFAGLASKAQSDFDELDELCQGQPCPASEQERVDDGRTLTLAANLSLGVGAALVAGGVLMIVFGGPDDAELAAQPLLSPDTAGVMLEGRF